MDRARDRTAAAQEARALLALAAPLIAGQVGNQLMGFVDTAMVGRVGAAAMGGVGIGGGIFFTLSLVAMGCAMGMDPLVTQAIGAGERLRARRIYWQGVRVALFASVPVIGLILLAPAILPPVGVAPEVVAATRSYLWGRVWNAIPIALFGAARCYLQATGHTRAIVVATILANIVNFVANYVLIYGDGGLSRIGLPAVGLPALGPFGAGLASTIASGFSAYVLFRAVGAVSSPPDPDRRRRDRELERRILRIGLPIGLQLLVEVSAFAAASVMSGRIGVVAAAANQIALTLSSMTFMVPVGIAMATAVRVGQAIGRGDVPGTRRAGLTGFGAGAAFMALSAVVFMLIPGALARVLTDGADVVAASVPLIRIAAVFQLFDGIQAVGAGALRGVGETSTALIANLVGHFAFGLPLAIYLGFYAGLGASGLWWGLTVGLVTVGVALVGRFWVVSGRPIARV